MEKYIFIGACFGIVCALVFLERMIYREHCKRINWFHEAPHYRIRQDMIWEKEIVFMGRSVFTSWRPLMPMPDDDEQKLIARCEKYNREWEDDQ